MHRIGRYEVIGELGSGAMGVVYAAMDPLIGRKIALKTIHVEHLIDPDEAEFMRDRLFREARSAGMLDHPGIVTIYDVGQDGDLAFIAMECVDGPTLQQLLIKTPKLNYVAVVDILVQAAAALDFAHAVGVIHRDIKPGNMMLHRGSIVKVADFGLAKLTAIQHHTQTGMLLGTPSYMSPEQVENKEVSGRSDQFALAVVAFEMLSGTRPFRADSMPALAYAITHGHRPSARALNPELPTEADVVLSRGLALAVENRYATCSEFAGALRVALSGGVPSAALQSKQPEGSISNEAAADYTWLVPPESAEPPPALSASPVPSGAAWSRAREPANAADVPPLPNLPEPVGLSLAAPKGIRLGLRLTTAAVAVLGAIALLYWAIVPSIVVGPSSETRSKMGEQTAVERIRENGTEMPPSKKENGPIALPNPSESPRAEELSLKRTASAHPPPAPAAKAIAPQIVEFQAEPSTPNRGDKFILRWKVEGASQVSIDHEISYVAPEGTISLTAGPPTIFTLLATGKGGTVTAQTAVTVAEPAPKVLIRSTPDSIDRGKPATLQWFVENASTVTLDGKAVISSGSQEILPNTTITYTIRATGGGHEVFRSVTVRVKEVAAGTNTSASSEAAVKRVTIGATAMARNMLRMVRPAYPQVARDAGVQGTVRFNAIIGTDGKVVSAEYVNGPRELVEAAHVSAMQRVYRPLVQNGKPVEVTTQIDVKFVLK